MARKRRQTLSVSQLQQLLIMAEKEVATLQVKRTKLASQLEEVDARLAELGAPRRGRPAKGATKPKKATGVKEEAPKKQTGKKKPGRKKMTLAAHVEKILAAARTPISPKEIAKALMAKGVSKAKSLSVQVGQVLASDKLKVKKAGRGKYLPAG